MPLPAHHHTLLAFAISLVAMGCGTDRAPAPEMLTRTDSAGVEIVTSADSAWTADTRWRLSPAPLLTIGDVPAAPDPYQFLTVSDAMRRSDGTLVVANAGTREVRLFSADGMHLKTLGGPGEGPEDYGYPAGLQAGPGAGFTVLDRSDRVVYDATGEFVERIGFDHAAWSRAMAPIGRSEGGRPLLDGRMLTPVYGADFFGDRRPSAGPPYRPEITMIRMAPETGTADTVAHIGGVLQQFLDLGGVAASPVVPPFAPSGRWFVAHDGGAVVYDGALPEVHRLTRDGTHRIVRWVAEAEPVTGAEIEAALDLQRNSSWAQSRLPELERGWAAVEMPTHKPYVTLAHAALDGSTWVRTGSHGPARSTWRVFAADGRWLGSLELPASFTPMEIGADYLLGVDRDAETEVEVLELYELVNPLHDAGAPD